ncbi:MAG: hypothetical protein CVU48_06475 [Candidatus Cloacimonetes bacterium HGW-Cloacimonetes-1]|jgi:hypothetical protein|nr:MAG: hypothetical protein CVU48_06475 [Candidatus Cloacimonetes bacterium HGW-Cloacimonetes-1]
MFCSLSGVVDEISNSIFQYYVIGNGKTNDFIDGRKPQMILAINNVKIELKVGIRHIIYYQSMMGIE